jgi:hypothetical protein
VQLPPKISILLKHTTMVIYDTDPIMMAKTKGKTTIYHNETCTRLLHIMLFVSSVPSELWLMDPFDIGWVHGDS